MSDYHGPFVPRCWYISPPRGDAPGRRCAGIGVFPIPCANHHHYLCVPHAFLLILKLCLLLRQLRDSNDHG
jgi:hypothetical protein